MSAREFEGRVALVTGGGGSCIGGPTALRFAEEGASVVICDLHERRNREMAERIRKETGARVLDFHLDIADRAQQTEAVLVDRLRDQDPWPRHPARHSRIPVAAMPRTK